MAAHAAESGQILPLVALAAMTVLAAVALGIDGSRIFEERRAAQTAVDHAATAAAYVSCNGGTAAAATSAGQAAAVRNGYDDAAGSITVTINQLGTAAEHTIRATITSAIPSTFGRFIGIDTFTVSVEAIAGGTGCAASFGSIPTAIYAAGDNCNGGKYAVDVSGSNDEVYGGVHSNSDANVGGGSNVFTETTYPDDVLDPWTYVGSLTLGSIGNGNVYQTGYPLDVDPSSAGWPAGWAPADVTGGTDTPPAAGSMLRAYYDLASANGTLFTSKVTSVTKDGVYYTSSTDGMDISSSTSRKIVLVAPRGPIKVSGSGVNWTAITDAEIDALPGLDSGPNLDLNLPRPGILMLSNYQHSGLDKCDKYAIAVSGSSSDWNGILWAPGGLVEMSGSSNVASNGSLLGWAVRLNGSDLIIRHDGDLFTTPADPEVLILR
jgi:hypothetical protein